MSRRRRWVVRGLVGVVVLLSTLLLVQSYLAAGTGGLTVRQQADLPADQRSPVAPERDGMTVVTTQQRQNANRAPGYILAVDAEGTVAHYNQTYHSYWDVDPVPGTEATVLYVAAEDAGEACPDVDCWRNVVERVNLQTGETTRMYERVVPSRGSARWHDVDRLNDTHLLVSDIAEHRAFVVDHRTGVVEWTWAASAAFEPTDGGVYPDDWTHLNDVERVPDGRVMASPRNMDQVVFIDRETGLQEAWTLGSDDDHEILYEQHNPDYIPAAAGGPAVLVSDSENNRVIEYRREDGEWMESWQWADRRLQWPRDADRLPSGRTLVTDTHGGRVLEVAPNGSVVWELQVIAPYEAERLGTGDESAGGPSAARAGLEGRQPAEGGGGGNPVVGALLSVLFTLSNLVPSVIVNGLLWVVPPWMGAKEILVAGFGLVSLGGLGVAELRWRYDVTVRSPLEGTLQLPVAVSRSDAD